MDVNDFKNQVDSKKLMSHGLVVLLDYNEDRMGLETNKPLEAVLEKDLVDMKEKDDNEGEAMIYIETLGMHKYTYIKINF